LNKLEAHQFNVFGEQPVRISTGQKLLLVLRSWIRFVCGTRTPDYGTTDSGK